MTLSIFGTIIQLLKFLPKDLRQIKTKKLIVFLIFYIALSFYVEGVANRIIMSEGIDTLFFLKNLELVYSTIILLLMLIISREFLTKLLRRNEIIVASNSFFIKHYIYYLIPCVLNIFVKHYYSLRLEVISPCILIFGYNILLNIPYSARMSQINARLYLKKSLIAMLVYIAYYLIYSSILAFAFISMAAHPKTGLLLNIDNITRAVGAIILGVVNARLSFLFIQHRFIKLWEN